MAGSTIRCTQNVVAHVRSVDANLGAMDYGLAMVRAGIFIGVDRTGKLQTLMDAAGSAKRMHAWALAQGMADETQAKLLTDENKKVGPDEIFDFIKGLIDGPGIDQLIVYFAGHGVNVNRSEHWLLSEAPVKASAAVNVAGSVDLARYCGIRHVVLISDACRVAPAGIQAQGVRGIDIFPNEAVSDRAQPVDQFFACVLGRPAAEIQDPQAAASGYRAVYTTALIDALTGARADVLDGGDDPGDTARYLKPTRLQQYLETEVPARVRRLKLQNMLSQNPDAILTVHPHWVSRVNPPLPPQIAAAGMPPAAAPEGPERMRSTRSAAVVRPNVQVMAHNLFRSAVAGDRDGLNLQIASLKAAAVADEGVAMADSVERIATPFGPGLIDTACGIKVRGGAITGTVFSDDDAAVMSRSEDLLVLRGLTRPVSILVSFKGGMCAVIPALPGFITGVTFDDNELVDVAFEPSANTGPGEDYQNRASDVRALRAVAASASRHGRLRLDGNDAANIASRLRSGTYLDPTLALYLAYAYHDAQELDRIGELAGRLKAQLGMVPFDVALLARQLFERSIAADANVFPFAPLLSRGWALLRANRVRLHPALSNIERTMQSSLWSLFDRDGFAMLVEAISSGGGHSGGAE